MHDRFVLDSFGVKLISIVHFHSDCDRANMFHSSTTGDSAIRETDNDAAVARLSAVRKGYLDDPYVRYFIPRAHLLPPRPPLINIGTYIRTTVLDSLICKWLQLSGNAGKKCQIVSLGAGSDSRFWRLMAS